MTPQPKEALPFCPGGRALQGRWLFNHGLIKTEQNLGVNARDRQSVKPDSIGSYTEHKDRNPFPLFNSAYFGRIGRAKNGEWGQGDFRQPLENTLKS